MIIKYFHLFIMLPTFTSAMDLDVENLHPSSRVLLSLHISVTTDPDRGDEPNYRNAPFINSAMNDDGWRAQFNAAINRLGWHYEGLQTFTQANLYGPPDSEQRHIYTNAFLFSPGFGERFHTETSEGFYIMTYGTDDTEDYHRIIKENTDEELNRQTKAHAKRKAMSRKYGVNPYHAAEYLVKLMLRQLKASSETDESLEYNDACQSMICEITGMIESDHLPSKGLLTRFNTLLRWPELPVASAANAG